MYIGIIYPVYELVPKSAYVGNSCATTTQSKSKQIHLIGGVRNSIFVRIFGTSLYAHTHKEWIRGYRVSSHQKTFYIAHPYLYWFFTNDVWRVCVCVCYLRRHRVLIATNVEIVSISAVVVVTFSLIIVGGVASTFYERAKVITYYVT